MHRFTDWPLRTKLTALFVAVALLPLVISTAIDIRDARHRLATQSAALLAARGDQLVGTAAPTRLILLEDNDSVRAATELFLTLEGAVLNTPDDA